MDLPELRAILASVTYKPGWTFGVVEYINRPGECVLSVAWRAEDATDVGELTLEINRIVNKYDLAAWNRHDALYNLFNLILKCEDHEAREWFKVDGVAIHDPHK